MQEISPIKKRILQYIDIKGLSKYQFYKDSGITRGVLDKDSGISEDNIAKFIAYDTNINFQWLLTGEGPMLKNQKSDNSVVAQPTPSNRKTTDPIHDIQRIPLYNITATMGLIPTDGTNSEHLIDFLSIPNLPLCDGAMYAMGDSMYPLLKAGDIVVYKKVDIDPSTIFFGEIYVLSIYLDSSSTMKSIKYIQKSDKGDDYVKLVSVNQHHSDKDIPLNKIAAMALVRAHIRIHN